MLITLQSVHTNVEESIESELKRLAQIRVQWTIALLLTQADAATQKEINDRDKIKSEMEKLQKEVAKGHKDAAKQRDVRRRPLHSLVACD